MKKKIISTILIIALVASVAGCGKNEDQAGGANNTGETGGQAVASDRQEQSEKDEQNLLDKDAKTSQKNETDSDKIASDNADTGTFKEGNGLPKASVSGTYENGLRKPGVTPIDPSIGNYHGYDGSPKLDSETLKKAVYDDSSYTGYKHITWTASNGVVLWLVDDPYLSDGKLLRHQGSIYDSPTAEPGTPESDAVEEFCFGTDENSSGRNEATYQDILKHKDDIKDIPETSVRPDFTNASGCMEAYRSEEMMNFRRANGKANAAERGALWYSSDENKIWAIFDIETNGKDIFWQTEDLNAKAWQLRWWEDDGTGTSSWQIQIYQNLSDIEWNSLKTMLKTCVAGPVYDDIYNRLYNSFYNRPDISGIEEFNTQYTFNGYNISCEYIEPQYGYVEYWIWE